MERRELRARVDMTHVFKAECSLHRGDGRLALVVFQIRALEDFADRADRLHAFGNLRQGAHQSEH